MASGERSYGKAVMVSSNRGQPARLAEPVEPLFNVSARQLALAYDRSTVAAVQQFKGKHFKILRAVEAINTDMFGNPYLALRGGVNQFMELQFELDEVDAAGPQSALRISLICTGRGDVANTPMSRDCEPAN